ncbi:MAG: hypothetical protein WAN36_07360, partial [Calditrichia bacterium]
MFKYIVILAFGFLIMITGCTNHSKSKASDDYKFPNESHLKNIKMLTHGGENAEAYLSFDEERIIFQATRDGMKCDQEFIMNMDGSDVQLVSTGKGRTTCGYFLPGDSTILYASTHLASPDCPPAPDMSRGYVWKLYDSFDIFKAGSHGKIISRLTDT